MTEQPMREDDLDDKLEQAFDRAENPPPKKGGLGSLFAVLVALLALGASGYLVYKDMTTPVVEVYDARADVQRLTAQLTKVDQIGGDLESRVSEAVAAQTAALKQQQEIVDSSLQDLRSQMSVTGQDYLLAEVEYLLRMANQRVLMERDPVGALAMFRAVDELMKEKEGLTAFGLRQALAEDIAKLEAVQSIDREGIYLRLAALAKAVPELRQPTREYIPDNTPDPEADMAQTDLWSKTLALFGKAANRLASLVDFRREQPEVKPVLPPQEEYYLRQNLILKLQVAQLALLAEEKEIFLANIEEAKSWARDYFDPEDAGTIALMKALEELGRIDVSQKLPDVSQSLREARALMKKVSKEG